MLGRNGGGFCAGFVAPGGGLVVPHKVDWVQFRIWRTYPVRAGSPSKNANATGWSAVIELQVFGDPKDVLTIPPEVLQRRKAVREAFAKLPKQSPYEKKATWQETMQAAREALVRWECQLDALASAIRAVAVAGVFPAEAAARIDREMRACGLKVAKPAPPAPPAPTGQALKVAAPTRSEAELAVA